MATVLLAGAYGQRNPGDEALLASFVQALTDHEIVATSVDPDATRDDHGCDAVSSLDRAAVVGALLHCDAVVVGGGTVFKALHPSTGRAPNELLRNASLLTFAARAASKPVLLVGVGAAPLTGARARRSARRLVRRADLLVLRDEASARVLEQAGAPVPFRVGADPTWPFLTEAPMVTPAPDDAVLVTLSHFAADSPGFVEALAGGLRALRADGLSIALQPWQVGASRGDDLPMTHALATEIGGPVELLDPPRDLHEATRQAAGARLVVSMRFHSLVAAAAAGTRVVAVDHEPKLGALARAIGQESVALGADGRWPAALRGAVDGRRPDPGVRDEQVALATEAFRLTRLVLEGGVTSEVDQLTGLPLEPRIEQIA
jgi:polysaccharide pyruvyl transferase CsaB